MKIGIETSLLKNDFENKTNHLKEWINEDIDIIIVTDDGKSKKKN